MLEPMDLCERVRELAAEGGDLTAMRARLDRVLRASVPYDIAAISTVDPATLLWTSCFLSGQPAGDGRDRENVLYELEFTGADLNGYRDLANDGRLVGRLHQTTGGDLTRAKRWEPLLSRLSCVDEMRVILRSGAMTWGTLTLYRTGGSRPFSDRDEATVRAALTAIADLFRLTMLRAALASPGGVERPPGLLLVTARGEIESVTDDGRAWLAALDDRGRLPSVVRSIAVAAATGNGLARAALPARDHHWVVLHGSPMPGGDPPAIAIIIEGARPVVVSEVIAGAYGLTPREREVIGLAAQGRSTRQMATVLGISPFTAQDHLKAVFTKTGVRTRAELVATLYVQQYEPRRASASQPSPYGWYLDDQIPA
ncbi:hypothetical protein I6A84_21885 [Frankia sp. CNm7]|nr:LuxR C-terminal-related transcriptional regulator [Frankia nepalensis]MBL7520663.1 hypothetical protein [Frankia nepalensis]